MATKSMYIVTINDVTISLCPEEYEKVLDLMTSDEDGMVIIHHDDCVDATFRKEHNEVVITTYGVIRGRIITDVVSVIRMFQV